MSEDANLILQIRYVVKGYLRIVVGTCATKPPTRPTGQAGLGGLTDIADRTIAYSKADASSQYDAFDLMQRYRVKPRPVLIAGATATFDQVTAGKIDVG